MELLIAVISSVVALAMIALALVCRLWSKDLEGGGKRDG